MKVSQLRDLTRRYASGGIPYEAYVAERMRLIDGMVAGEIEVRYRELEPAAPATNTTNRNWFLAGSLMLVGLLLIALLAYFLGDAKAPSEQITTTTAVTANAENPGATLLEQFLLAGDWSEPALESLESGWKAMTPFQQENARRSVWHRRLKHEISQRISEQEALLAAGQMEALLSAGRLREFAASLGLEAG